MALDADIVGAHVIQAGGIHDVLRRGTLNVVASGPVALFAADVPLGDRLGFEVVVHRMASIAQRTGGALHIVGRIEGSPPIGARGCKVGTPDLMRDVPLG